jgi:hypothetical protein
MDFVMGKAPFVIQYDAKGFSGFVRPPQNPHPEALALCFFHKNIHSATDHREAGNPVSPRQVRGFSDTAVGSDAGRMVTQAKGLPKVPESPKDRRHRWHRASSPSSEE